MQSHRRLLRRRHGLARRLHHHTWRGLLLSVHRLLLLLAIHGLWWTAHLIHWWCHASSHGVHLVGGRCGRGSCCSHGLMRHHSTHHGRTGHHRLLRHRHTHWWLLLLHHSRVLLCWWVCRLYIFYRNIVFWNHFWLLTFVTCAKFLHTVTTSIAAQALEDQINYSASRTTISWRWRWINWCSRSRVWIILLISYLDQLCTHITLPSAISVSFCWFSIVELASTIVNVVAIPEDERFATISADALIYTPTIALLSPHPNLIAPRGPIAEACHQLKTLNIEFTCNR